MDEMDLTAAEKKASYEEIKAYVLEHSGLKVSNLYIAQVKRIAWESLYHHFEKYVHSRAWNRMKKLDMTPDRKKDLEEELYQAGWRDFCLPSQIMIRSRGNF